MTIRIIKQLTMPFGFSSNNREFTEEYLIHLDDPKTTKAEIEAHPDYPIRYEQHADYPEYFCIDTKVKQPIQSPNIRPMTVQWSNVIPAAHLVDGKPKYDDNPLKRPVEIEWGTYSSQKTIRMAYDDDQIFDPKKAPPEPSVPVVTTAGEPIFMQIPVELRQINFSKNVQQVPAFMAKAGNFVNSDTVKIAGISFAPKELMAGGLIISKPNFANGQLYYVFSWYFLVALDEAGWVEKRRNAGFHEKDYQFLDQSGKIVPAPVPGGERETVMRPIFIGPPENRHFPATPVLLTTQGRAFRAKGPNDTKDDPETNTGEILTTQSASGKGITPEQWQAAELKFNPRLLIPFKKYFPLR